jgi:hypothetical protein
VLSGRTVALPIITYTNPQAFVHFENKKYIALGIKVQPAAATARLRTEIPSAPPLRDRKVRKSQGRKDIPSLQVNA